MFSVMPNVKKRVRRVSQEWLGLLFFSFFAFGCSIERDFSSDEQFVRDEELLSEARAGDPDHMGIISGTSPDALVKKSTVALLAGTSLCSGTIISEKYILTASHCVTNSVNLSGWKVVFGTNVYSTLWRPVVTVINDNLTADLSLPDIAIVEFSGGIPNGFSAAKLPTAQTLLSIGEKLTIAGYGRWSTTSAGSGILFQGEGIMLESSKTYYLMVGRSGETQHCSGDSGGPTYIKQGNKLIVVGVTSHGAVPCTQGAYVTDVKTQLDWINSKVEL
ncbi:MAG: hypothetical protein RL189_1800 [Pseudomonadota bacterium]|jgi:hypothetical protein